MIKLQIVDGSLQVSSNGTIILVAPKNSCAIDVLSLYDTIPLVVIYNKYLGTSTNIFTQPLANCVDSVNVPFSVNTFIDFAEANFGFDTTGGGCGGCNSPFKYNANLSGIEPILGTNDASGTNATIGGGTTNTASGVRSTIGGGDGNTASCDFSTIGGGQYNTASCNWSTVGGGYCNTASGNTSFIGGGYCNITSENRSTIGGGYCNIASGRYSTIGGGYQNTASCDKSFVGGGYCNISSNYYSTVGGGQYNTASGANSIIGGGKVNTASGASSTIGGGSTNTASGNCSTIGGGCSNTNNGCFGFIGGGKNNSATNESSTIAGGKVNLNKSDSGFIGGGTLNLTSNATIFNSYCVNSNCFLIYGDQTSLFTNGDNFIASNINNCSYSGQITSVLYSGGYTCLYTDQTFTYGNNPKLVNTTTAPNGCNFATIGGGFANRSFGSLSTVGGGYCNTASAYCSTVGGGGNNTASGDTSFIGGGYCNITSENRSTIGGGYCNIASGRYSTIGGGKCNTASNFNATIGGGRNNTASGNCSTIGGGYQNTASGYCSTIGGGQCNTASGCMSAILGGSTNTASGTYSNVDGGFCNITNSRHSTIGGGQRNIIQSPTNECCSFGATIGGGIGHNTNGGTLDATTGDLTGAITCCNAGKLSTISGGLLNCGTGNYSTIAGGKYNTASGNNSVVGGGYCNTASCYFSTIGGGKVNVASGAYSIIGGGYCNLASGCYSGILGGRYNNTNNCDFAMIVGSNITADRDCTTFVNDLTISSMASCSGCSVQVSANGLLVANNLTGGIHAFVKPSVGFVTSSSINGTALTTISGIANKLTVTPFIPAQTITSQNLFINVTTQVASSNAQIVIYSDLNGKPNTRLYQSANLDCSTIGIKTATTVQTFEAGTTYWIGMQTSSTQVLSALGIAQLIPVSQNGIVFATSFTIAPTFGSAPNPFGTPTAQNLSVPFVGITL